MRTGAEVVTLVTHVVTRRVTTLSCHKSNAQVPPLGEIGVVVGDAGDACFSFRGLEGVNRKSENRVTNVTTCIQPGVPYGFKLVTHTHDSCVTNASPTSPGCFGEL